MQTGEGLRLRWEIKPWQCWRALTEWRGGIAGCQRFIGHRTPQGISPDGAQPQAAWVTLSLSSYGTYSTVLLYSVSSGWALLGILLYLPPPPTTTCFAPSILGLSSIHLTRSFSVNCGRINPNVSSETSERLPQVECETCRIVKYNRNVDRVARLFNFQTAQGLRGHHRHLTQRYLGMPGIPNAVWSIITSFFSTEEPVSTRDKTLFPHLQKEAQNV